MYQRLPGRRVSAIVSVAPEKLKNTLHPRPCPCGTADYISSNSRKHIYMLLNTVMGQGHSWLDQSTSVIIRDSITLGTSETLWPAVMMVADVLAPKCCSTRWWVKGTRDLIRVQAWSLEIASRWGLLSRSDRPSSSWWLHMSWRQIGARPSATTMLTGNWP